LRIEINDDLGELLDVIKDKEKTIYGRGHAETVRFLANYYQTHKPVQLLFEGVLSKIQCVLDETESRIPAAIERSFRKTLAQAITNLLTLTDGNQPQ